MAKKEIEYTIRNDNQGDFWLMNYDNGYWNGDVSETFTDNEPFKATMEVIDHYKGRSASGLIVQVKGHKRFPKFKAYMGTAEVTKLILNNDLMQGVVHDITLKFGKRGRNYFIVNG